MDKEYNIEDWETAFMVAEPGPQYDLEERLIDFAVEVIKLTDKFPKNNPGKYFSNQLTRSSASPALNYAEAKGGESRRDFLHKSKIALKELRETLVALKIVLRLKLTNEAEIERNRNEAEQLVAIFVRLCATTEKNLRGEK